MSSNAYDVQRSSLPARPVAGQSMPAPEVGAVAQTRVLAVRPDAALIAVWLVLLGSLLLAFVAFTGGLSHVIHARAQSLHYADLREQLANGVAPVGTDLIAPGAPVALLEIPVLGLREVVLEGTTSGVLREGPGHRRDTVLPGQAGTAVVFGRRAAFGGPFAEVSALRPGAEFAVTTGQGRFTYRVLGTRRGGDMAPQPPDVGAGRLTLVTAGGPPYLPSEAVRIDTALVGDAAPAPVTPRVALTGPEAALAGDSAAVPALTLWAAALLLASCAAVWLRARWGLRQAWVVSVPVLVLIGTGLSGAAVQLLPNLL